MPQDHLLRSIDRFVDLGSIRAPLADFYSNMGRPSVDPELLIQMLLVGYCFGIRSERGLCWEVRVERIEVLRHAISHRVTSPEKPLTPNEKLLQVVSSSVKSWHI